MKNYNKDEEESFLQYNDANNLYGFAMLEPLPVDGFEWMEAEADLGLLQHPRWSAL